MRSPVKAWILPALLCATCLSTPVSLLAEEANTSGKWWIRPTRERAGHDGSPAVSRNAPVAGPAAGRREIAEDISRFGFSFALHTTAHFQVLYRQRGCPPRLLAQTGDLLEQAYQQFYGEFKRSGFKLDSVGQRLDWLVFDDQGQYRDFAQVADGMNTPYLESYYSARTNQVVLMQSSATCRGDDWEPGSTRAAVVQSQVAGMDPAGDGPHRDGGMLDIRRAVHEAAHQLAFNSGLQARGVMYPLWVSEGLATNFECDTTAGIGVGRDNPPRRRQLLRACDAGRLMDLDEFVTMVQIPVGGRASPNDLYAQAWGMFNFLFRNHRSELRSYLGTLARAEQGSRDPEVMEAEFAGAFGSTSRLRESWSEYLRKLDRRN